MNAIMYGTALQTLRQTDGQSTTLWCQSYDPHFVILCLHRCLWAFSLKNASQLLGLRRSQVTNITLRISICLKFIRQVASEQQLEWWLQTEISSVVAVCAKLVSKKSSFYINAGPTVSAVAVFISVGDHNWIIPVEHTWRHQTSSLMSYDRWPGCIKPSVAAVARIKVSPAKSIISTFMVIGCNLQLGSNANIVSSFFNLFSCPSHFGRINRAESERIIQ